MFHILEQMPKSLASKAVQNAATRNQIGTFSGFIGSQCHENVLLVITNQVNRNKRRQTHDLREFVLGGFSASELSAQ
jgi:hypothetical protein